MDNLVWRVDPATNSLKRSIAVGNHPTGVAVGAGSVWVANEGGGTVSRIDPSANKVVATIRLAHSPGAVAVGYGRVWVSVRAP
jgi:YVTN family beta-propeller protein